MDRGRDKGRGKRRRLKLGLGQRWQELRKERRERDGGREGKGG